MSQRYKLEINTFKIEKIVIKKLSENNVVYGYTRYINIDRETAWLPCDIMKYSPFEKKY